MNKSLQIVKRLTLYFGSLSVLVAGLTKYKEEVQSFLNTDNELALAFTVAFPLIVIVIFDGIPRLKKYQKDRIIRDTVKCGKVVDPQYFQLTPRLSDQSSNLNFRRDNAHIRITNWVRNSKETVLFLSGSSGTGKSSILHAYTLPILKPAIHSIVVRGLRDPLSAIIDRITKPGYIWKRNVPDIQDPLELINRALKIINEKRMLIIFDQFEETLILSDEDDTKINEFISFIKVCDNKFTKNIQFLIILRSDYIGRLQDLELAQMVENINWMTISAFSVAHSKEFLRMSGMEISDYLIDRIITHAINVEDTEGLIRPITLNMIGLILSNKYYTSVKKVPKNIFYQYLQDCLNHPEIRYYSFDIINNMITPAGTKIPLYVEDLKKITHFDRIIILGVLLKLGNMGLVRQIGERTDMWEIAHDFVADLLRRLLTTSRKKLFLILRPFISPIILCFWAISLIILLPPYLENRSIAKLNELQVNVSHDGGDVIVKYVPGNTNVSITDSMKYLKWIKNLKTIVLSTDTTGIDNLSQLQSLESLSIMVFDGADYSSIGSITQLKNLDLSGNLDIENVDCLSSLINLKHLELSNTNITDINPLINLVELEKLDLHETLVTDITPLKNMRKLRILKIHKTKVSDISVISQLVSLEEFWAFDTDIEDISPLKDLKYLKLLDLKNCPLNNNYKEIYRILEANNPNIKLWKE